MIDTVQLTQKGRGAVAALPAGAHEQQEEGSLTRLAFRGNADIAAPFSQGRPCRRERDKINESFHTH